MSYLFNIFGIIILLIIAGCSPKWPKENSAETSNNCLQTIWAIDLQEGFQNDIVALIVESAKIFHDRIVSTESSSQFTGYKATLYKSEGTLIPVFLHTYAPTDNHVSEIDLPDSTALNITIIITSPDGNQTTKEIKIDKKKGRYIGLSKSFGETDIIYVRQNHKPFSYY